MQEAFRCYTPYDPEAAKTEETLIFVFVNQAAHDIRNKLVKLEGLGERNIRDLMTVAERVFYTRKSAEEKEIKKQRRQEKSLARCWWLNRSIIARNCSWLQQTETRLLTWDNEMNHHQVQRWVKTNVPSVGTLGQRMP